MNGTMNTTQYDIMKSCDIVSMTVHYLVLAEWVRSRLHRQTRIRAEAVVFYLSLPALLIWTHSEVKCAVTLKWLFSFHSSISFPAASFLCLCPLGCLGNCKLKYTWIFFFFCDFMLFLSFSTRCHPQLPFSKLTIKPTKVPNVLLITHFK